MNPIWIRHTTSRLFLCAAMLCLSGCNVLGVVGYKLSGPPTIKAKYAPKQELMLVLAENYNNPSAGEFDSDRLARQLVEELKTHKVAPVIEASEVSDFRRAHDPEYHKMTIPAIARALGAKQVLYVDVREFRIEPAVGSELFKGRAEVHVRIVDAADGATLWPQDSAGGMPIARETPYIKISDPADEMRISEQLAQSMADQIAKLFYTWKVDESVGAD